MRPVRAWKRPFLLFTTCICILSGLLWFGRSRQDKTEAASDYVKQSLNQERYLPLVCAPDCELLTIFLGETQPATSPTEAPGSASTTTPVIKETLQPSRTAGTPQTPSPISPKPVSPVQTPTPKASGMPTISSPPANPPPITAEPSVPPLTQTSTQTPAETFMPTASATQEPSLTPTETNTPSITPSPTATPTPSSTPTATHTPTPSITPSPTHTPTPSITPSPTHTPTPSRTPSPTATFTPVVTPTPRPTMVVNPAYLFVETFDGSPSAPQAWTSPSWELTIHQRDQDRLYEMLPMGADHGPNCEPPPATHTVTAFEDNLYICHNHMMTANYGQSDIGGYGLVYFTPDRLIDTTGDFFIEFDVSTYRVNNLRNWFDVWITPYDKNLQLTLNNTWPDLQGPPTESIQVMLTKENRLLLLFHDGGSETALLAFDDLRGFESVLEMSRKTRTTFRIEVEGDQLKIGLPAQGLWWYDRAAPEMFRRSNFREAIVQFGHHSYTPEKECAQTFFPSECADQKADTFHWDNVTLYPASPFDLIHGSPRLITASSASKIFILDQPAPSNAHLRFGGIGKTLEVSFDGGETWETAQQQAHTRSNIEEHFGSFWMPIPAGTTAVHFRGEDWFNGEWAVRDMSVWGR
ncbi:MAG: hypothetical protein AAF633_02940 [Chloroflexota bacterium]